MRLGPRRTVGVVANVSAWAPWGLEEEPDSFPKMLQFFLKRNLLFIRTNFLPLSCLFYYIHPLIKTSVCNFLYTGSVSAPISCRC